MAEKGYQYLAKNLVGLEIEENGDYCTGKFTGCTKSLVEGYMAVTLCSFVRISSHTKGSTKRFKGGKATRSSIFFSQTNSWIPIPENGYPFELISTERWNCTRTSKFKGNEVQSSKEPNKKRRKEENDCNASIQIRTIHVYTEYGIPDRANMSDAELKKTKMGLKDKLLAELENGTELKWKKLHYCRFPLLSAHHHAKSDLRPSPRQMDKRVINKIRELAKSGICDVHSIKAIMTDYVQNTLFAHAEADEKPNLDDKRYFPSLKAIRNHVFLAMGSTKNRGCHSSNREEVYQPSITNIVEMPVKCDVNEADKSCGKDQNFRFGFVAVHAGAGYHSNPRWPGYKHLCSSTCREVTKQLRIGVLAGEAVTLAVKMLEDSEMTNAGFGSNLTEDGKVECDASVMDTTPSADPANHCDSYFGSVACVNKIRNPVQAAYKILDERRKRSKLELGRIPPCFMVSEGAENWSRAHGVEMCSSDDLISESASKTWQKYHRRLLEKLANHESSSESVQNDDVDECFSQRLDTVGAVVLDLEGNVAASLSSGGLALKLPGRVGQAAAYGCGCWAEPRREHKPAVAVTTSGCGEQLVSTMLARKCAENLQSSSEPYQALQDTLVNDFLNSPMLNPNCEKQAGILCLHLTKDENNSTAEVVWGHTTSSMVIGHMSTNDISPKVELSRLPENATPGKSVTVGGSWTKVVCRDRIEIEPLGEGGTGTDQNLDVSTSPSLSDAANFSVQVDVEDMDENNSSVANHTQVCTDNCDDLEEEVDDELAVMFVSPLCDGLLESDCKVQLSDDFHRKIDPEFEKQIQHRWQERVAKNPRLFNGHKFRMHSVNCDEQSKSIDGQLNQARLTFNLGLTSYRDYMETNWSTQVQDLKEKGIRDFQNSQAYMAEPLGVAAIVVTEDNKAVFQWRNSWLAESPNLLDVPGGHPEPTDALTSNVSGVHTVNISDLKPDDVLREIFQSQVKEVRDELNVPLETITNQRLMGLVRNKLSAGRPVAYFIMRCTLPSEAIIDLYSKGGAETDESTRLQFLRLENVPNLQRDEPEIWKEMCPNGKAACTLYSILERKRLRS